MTDKFISELMEALARNFCVITKSEIKEIEEIDGETRFIAIDDLVTLIKDIKSMLKEEAERDNINKKLLTPKTKFLYVEDGSIDLEELESQLFNTNPEIKIIIYRQGSNPPILLNGVNNNDR